MDGHRFTPPSGRRSHERDAQVRAVTRITRGVAAVAVLGTAVFGGLAAAATGSSQAPPAAVPGATASASAAADATGAVIAPAASTQPPVASSGGS
ncbi:hypothetical protein [Miltoncostaea oceani]|uniref:hypothetical protein n=1 Tax=Miltoncostaea oceani TaxID=2843216 RepID=UPI001C3DED60|nr:hypothetical protein [Miltoncostaea oceani]